MRKIRWALAALLGVLGALVSLTTQAAPIPPRSGWSGEVSPLLGVIGNRSNLTVSDDQARLDSLYARPPAHTRGLFGLVGTLHYTLAPARWDLFAGIPARRIRDGDFLLEAGMRYRLPGVGQLRGGVVSLTPWARQVWADPFVTGTERQRTHRSRRGITLGLGGIAESRFSIDYTLLQTRIDQEVSGRALGLDPMARARLNREGNEHQFDLGYHWRLSARWSVSPGIRYTLRALDGGANSGWLLRPQLSARWRTRSLQFTLTGYYGIDRYDQANPIFGRYRDGSEMGLVAGMRYQAPFGFEHWSINAYGLWAHTRSDIRFYENRTQLFALGLGYRF